MKSVHAFVPKLCQTMPCVYMHILVASVQRRSNKSNHMRLQSEGVMQENEPQACHKPGYGINMLHRIDTQEVQGRSNITY